MIYLKLFWEFFKTGLFAIGGGAATIPFLYDMSDRLNWFSYDDLANMIAVSESTPGAIGVNMSTYVGFTTANVLGGIISTIGLVTPSIIIIIIIAKCLKAFKGNKYVDDIFYGIRPASTALISVAAFTLLEIAIFHFNTLFETKSFNNFINYKGLILGSILMFLVLKFKKHPLFYIALSAVVGIVFNFSS